MGSIRPGPVRQEFLLTAPARCLLQACQQALGRRHAAADGAFNKRPAQVVTSKDNPTGLNVLFGERLEPPKVADVKFGDGLWLWRRGGRRLRWFVQSCIPVRQWRTAYERIKSLLAPAPNAIGRSDWLDVGGPHPP